MRRNSNRNAQTSAQFAALLEVRDDWLAAIASQDSHHCDWLKTFNHSHTQRSSWCGCRQRLWKEELAVCEQCCFGFLCVQLGDFPWCL